ncbi:MAG: amidohydrolase [Megasphaera sp.]|jgi:amidohydrolase|nr:amidohydrolase [Megasphaera sp.]MCH4217430.1 amidohydrolase [Megasphaera sp.]
MMNKNEMKKKACQCVDDLQSLIYGIADYLHEHPEIGTQEVLASAYLRNILEKYHFTVTDLVPEAFPTAFHATFGHGACQMAFLAEYDALPGLGHACGHNLIAAMSVGAAIAFSNVCGEAATVHVFGCPAEETEGSKIYMSDHGVFDDIDAAVIIHPGSDKTQIGGTSYATHPMEFTFLGKAAHVADPCYHGINALDALVDFYGKLKNYDKQLKERHIIGTIITDGGTAPNIIPDKAVMKATIRALDADFLEKTMLPQIRRMAQDVSAAHGTTLDMYHYEPLFRNMVNDARLDVYFADAFSELYEEFGIKDDEHAEGSTDVGDVSHITRVSQPEICIGCDIAAHTPAFAVAAGSTYGKMQALTGAKAMAMVGIDVMTETERTNHGQH